MPPRSANRKASAAKAKRLTPKSKELQVQSSVTIEKTVVREVMVDLSTTVDETKEVESWITDTNEETEARGDDDVLAKEVVVKEEGKNVVEAEEGKDVEGEEEAVMRGENEMERETEGLEVNSVENEYAVTTVVEVIEEEKSMDLVLEGCSNLSEKNLGAEMEDNSNLNGESVEEKEKNMDSTREDNSKLNWEDTVEKGNVACEEGGERKNGGDNNGDGIQMVLDRGAEQNSVEEETPAPTFEEMKALEDDDDIPDVRDGGEGEGEGGKSGDDKEDSEEDNQENSEDNEEDEDPSEFIPDHFTYRKREKDVEIYVGGLAKGAVEEDLIKIFGKFGEIQAARIVKNPTTKKSKGFAFIRYATVDQTNKALSELKDGIEVRGKRVKISASQDNDTLYVGNICKTWTKEKILETLKGLGIEQIEEIHLPNDPKKEGKSRGFILLEFSTHSYAMAAFQRIRKPDAVFGLNRSAKVAFAPTPMHPSEEVLSQIKTVYVEGLTDSWDEEKVTEICKQYGEIEKIILSRNLNTKRKDFGFITFTSRESALACMDGINNAQIVEGEVKVKADVAKPHFRGRLQKGTRGGFKVEKENAKTEQDGSSKMKGHAKSKGAEKESERTEKAGPTKMKGHAKPSGAEKKGKAVVEEKGKALPNSKTAKGGKPNKHQSSVTKDIGVGAPSKPERTNHKRKNLPSKGDGRRKRDLDHGYSQRPSKKARGNERGRRHPRSNHRFREGPVYGADTVAYRNPYASGYAASSSSYPGPAYSAVSGSKRQHSDMEPHAGYLGPSVGKQSRPRAGYAEPALGTQGRPYSGYHEPAVGDQGRPHAGYAEPALGTQGWPYSGYHEPAVGDQGRPHAGYAEPALGTQGRPYSGYHEPAVGDQGRPHAVYIEPALGTQSQPHAGYREPAVGNQGHDAYDYRLRRVGGYDGQGSRGSAYGGGSALPSSYVPNYTSHTGYEGGHSGGGYYRSSEAYVPRRAYY